MADPVDRGGGCGGDPDVVRVDARGGRRSRPAAARGRPGGDGRQRRRDRRSDRRPAGSGEYGRETPGRVAVWFGGKRGLRARADATFVEPALGDGNHPGSFGQAVAAVGDVNRDGFADIMVGAPSAGSCTASPNARLPPIDGGRVFLLAGARAGFAAAPLAFVDGARMGGRFGSAFRGIGRSRRRRRSGGDRRRGGRGHANLLRARARRTRRAAPPGPA